MSDPYHLPYWIDSPLPTQDYLLQDFSSDESIVKIMSLAKPLWEYHYHRSSFLPNANLMDSDFVSLISSDIVEHPQTPMLLKDVDYEGNLCNTTEAVPIDVSMKTCIVEHVHIGHNCSTIEIE